MVIFMINNVTRTDCKRFESCFNFKLATELGQREPRWWRRISYSVSSLFYCQLSMEGQKIVERWPSHSVTIDCSCLRQLSKEGLYELKNGHKILMRVRLMLAVQELSQRASLPRANKGNFYFQPRLHRRVSVGFLVNNTRDENFSVKQQKYPP